MLPPAKTGIAIGSQDNALFEQVDSKHTRRFTTRIENTQEIGRTIHEGHWLESRPRDQNFDFEPVKQFRTFLLSTSEDEWLCKHPRKTIPLLVSNWSPRLRRNHLLFGLETSAEVTGETEMMSCISVVKRVAGNAASHPGQVHWPAGILDSKHICFLLKIGE